MPTPSRGHGTQVRGAFVKMVFGHLTMLALLALGIGLDRRSFCAILELTPRCETRRRPLPSLVHSKSTAAAIGALTHFAPVSFAYDRD